MTEKEYVERKAVHDRLDRLSQKQFVDNDNDVYISLAEAHDVINEISSANVTPVRLGSWRKEHEHITLANGETKEWDNFYCSECDAPNDNPSNFCPCCGVKMQNFV